MKEEAFLSWKQWQTVQFRLLQKLADGESGYLIEIGDYARMADVICELEKKRFLLKDMGEKAFESISEKCHMKDHIEFWNQVLKELW